MVSVTINDDVQTHPAYSTVQALSGHSLSKDSWQVQQIMCLIRGVAHQRTSGLKAWPFSLLVQ